MFGFCFRGGEGRGRDRTGGEGMRELGKERAAHVGLC